MYVWDKEKMIRYRKRYMPKELTLCLGSLVIIEILVKINKGENVKVSSKNSIRRAK